MNKLPTTVKPVNLCPTLTPDEFRYVRANKVATRIALIHSNGTNAQKSEYKSGLIIIIAATIAAQTTTKQTKEDKKLEEVIAEMANLLEMEILNFFPKATIEDVRGACENGVRGLYGNFFGLSVVTIHGWLKKWFDDQLRQDALAKQAAWEESMANPSKPRTEKEKFIICANGVISAFDEFKKTGQVNKVAFAYYNFLKSHKLIDLSEDERAEIITASYAAVPVQKSIIDLPVSEGSTPQQLKAKELGLKKQFQKWDIQKINLLAKFKTILDHSFSQEDEQKG